MSSRLHILKLSVGTEGVEDLAAWQDARSAEARARGADDRPRHVTRMFPRRAEELLDGGSIYWVIRGSIQCRQRIMALDPVTGEDGVERCAIRLDSELIRTEPRARRPFQGWRYLAPADAPPDLPGGLREEGLPFELEAALAELGVRNES